jgi:hypothetical protein
VIRRWENWWIGRYGSILGGVGAGASIVVVVVLVISIVAAVLR